MRNIFKTFIAWLMVMAIMTGPACEKDENKTSGEESLRISTDASAVTITVAPDFTFQVLVESIMPPGGVSIETVVKGETDQVIYYQGPAIETMANNISITITNLPRQKYCVCNITVTSKSNGTNRATTSFRVGYK